MKKMNEAIKNKIKYIYRFLVKCFDNEFMQKLTLKQIHLNLIVKHKRN